MEKNVFRRKPAAVLSADAAGSSRLMRDDEPGIVKNLESNKQAFFDRIRRSGNTIQRPHTCRC
jgi:hypothetical protein